MLMFGTKRFLWNAFHLHKRAISYRLMSSKSITSCSVHEPIIRFVRLRPGAFPLFSSFLPQALTVSKGIRRLDKDHAFDRIIRFARQRSLFQLFTRLYTNANLIRGLK